MAVETIEEGAYDVASFAAELAAAPGNLAVGTSRLFENDRVRVWEVRLEPGEGRQRYADGTMRVLR
jgi:hypothetical protein